MSLLPENGLAHDPPGVEIDADCGLVGVRPGAGLGGPLLQGRARLSLGGGGGGKDPWGASVLLDDRGLGRALLGGPIYGEIKTNDSKVRSYPSKLVQVKQLVLPDEIEKHK